VTDWKRWIKHILGRTIFSTGLHRLLLRQRGVIVLFHRVDDRLKGNPLSCTWAEFDSFCRFFRRYFEVIPLSELLDRIEDGADVGGSLVITFDDGYLDNRKTAAPILRVHRLPACFFVASGFVGSSTVPWWDAELGINSEWMSWADVQELVDMGFEVGAHTVNHVDLGVVHGDEARNEIVNSGRQLSEHLGAPVPLFSYPYGREHQITEENRKVVQEAGYRCCPSAFGGDVTKDSDPFYLRRFPISNWITSPYHLGWELLFGNR